MTNCFIPDSVCNYLSAVATCGAFSISVAILLHCFRRCAVQSPCHWWYGRWKLSIELQQFPVNSLPRCARYITFQLDWSHTKAFHYHQSYLSAFFLAHRTRVTKSIRINTANILLPYSRCFYLLYLLETFCPFETLTHLFLLHSNSIFRRLTACTYLWLSLFYEN